MAIDLLEEEEYLKGLCQELKKAAEKLLGTTKYYSDNAQEAVKYIWENQSDFDGAELRFNLRSLDQLVDSGERARVQLRRIFKMLDSPYFARIDFRMQGEAVSEKIYIGKFSFWDIKSPYTVYDWRAPISSMYYEYEKGEACYEAPEGRVEGVIDCKRQYRIQKGVLEYALESDVSIEDEILQRELSKSSDHKMRDIVGTIQKEQNRLIRNEAETLIIQGVAGSGKTSIALHRIAYFLYRFREEISAENFLIISPNGIFVDYISNVLPELGEENIQNIGMDDIAARQLQGGRKPEGLKAQNPNVARLNTERTKPRQAGMERINTEGARDERLEMGEPRTENSEKWNPEMENPGVENSEKWNPGMENPEKGNPGMENSEKGNPGMENPEMENLRMGNSQMETSGAENLWMEHLKMERLCDQAERFQMADDEAWRKRNEFKATEDFVRRLDEYLAKCDRENFVLEDYPYEGGVIESEFMKKRYVRQMASPVRRRLEDIAMAMAEELRIQRKAKGFGTHKKNILEWLMSRYRHNDPLELYRNFYREMGREDLFVWDEERGLESADIFPLIYVKMYLDGGVDNRKIKHLVIDEMQDYTPIQYAVLNRLYPCGKTILGDFSQNVVPFTQGSLASLSKMYPGAQVVEIRKSYRSTCEIINFARKIRQQDIEPILRHGEEPKVKCCADENEMWGQILEIAQRAVSAEGSAKCGILCKNLVQAEELHLWLEGRMRMHPKLHLLNYDSDAFYDGVMVTAVPVAKGLEFDEVVIPDVDCGNYDTEYDRGLLYVACTRAMHRLTLLYCGKASRFLPLEAMDEEV